MADAYMVIGGEGIDEVIDNNGEFAYSSYNKNGTSPTGEDNYMKKKGSPNINVGDGTMLLNVLKDNASKVSSEISKATKKLDDVKTVIDKIATTSEKINNVKLKHLTFHETGQINGSQLIDSHGKQIRPLEAKARANAEYALDKSLENRIPYGDLVDDSDDIKNDDNIMSKVVSDFVNIDILKVNGVDNES
ncbi:hypothetical protein CRU98_10045 [Arcobacter sp. CECT 8986]|uniref:hypothetical protein n=1 Tax=Arcobacter sp. CECT 8986 TaxID=2044507 RepID=UPI001009D17F|nr:hypothetical protein [Arcobacter sp. CECT 8986]RXJ98370.1 hypothetical protein CRU98_10045 [Arcobacter sp. CECT 8986]